MKKLFSLLLTFILVTSLFGAVAVFATEAGDGMEGYSVIKGDSGSDAYTSVTNWTFTQQSGYMCIGNLERTDGKYPISQGDWVITFKTRASADASDITYMSNSLYTNAVYYANGVQQHTYSEIPSKGKALAITKDGTTWDEHKITFTRTSTNTAYMYFYIGFGDSGTIEIADFKVQTAEEANQPQPGDGCDGYTATAWSVTDASASGEIEIIPANASSFTFKKDYEYTISFKLKRTASYVTLKSSSYFIDYSTVYGWKYWVDGVEKTTPTDKKMLDQALTTTADKWETHKVTFVSPIEKKYIKLRLAYGSGATFSVADFKVEERYAGPEITIDEANSKFYDDNGTDTAIVYGTVNDFTATSEGEFGVTIETSAGKITLPMMGSEALANIADFKGQKFAIKVYGSAINKGTEYKFVPYFGTWTGAEVKLGTEYTE